MNYRCLILFISTLILISSCKGSKENINFLRDEFDVYVNAINTSNWKYLYDIQSEKQKDLRTFAYFSKQMSLSRDETNIDSYKIKRGEIEGDYGILHVVYNIQSNRIDGMEGPFRQNAKVILKKMDDNWVVMHSGLEAYFPILEMKLREEDDVF